MKKMLACALAAGLAASTGTAFADEHLHLTEQFASGAIFAGDLTFTDGYATLTGVDGTLSGGDYGSDAITWTWWKGNGITTPQNYDGNPATSEDWLMDGTPSSGYAHYIGLSWSAPDGAFQLALTPATNVYYAGINESDAAVSYSSVVPEAGSLSMMLAGAGLLGLTMRRRSQR